MKKARIISMKEEEYIPSFMDKLQAKINIFIMNEKPKKVISSEDLHKARVISMQEEEYIPSFMDKLRSKFNSFIMSPKLDKIQNKINRFF